MGDTAQPLDIVLLWLTATVEQDLDARGVFPRLRRSHAQALTREASLHYLSADDARAVLADGIERKLSARRAVRIAYSAHIYRVRCAVEQAAERAALIGSPEAFCADKCAHSERWLGTKNQLAARGIRLAGPWPHDPGGNGRWAMTRDPRGHQTNITLFSPVWPGLYQARITIRGSVADDEPEAQRDPTPGPDPATMALQVADLARGLSPGKRATVAALLRNAATDPDEADDIAASLVALLVPTKARDDELAKVEARRPALRLVWSAPV